MGSRRAGRRPLVRSLLVLVEETVPALMLAVIVVVITLAVILRYGFGRPPAWSGELAVALFVWQLFLGAAAAARHGRHIGVEVLVQRLPGRWRAAQELVQNAVVFAVLATLAYLGWRFSRTPTKQLLLIDVDYAWVYRAVPVGFLLAAIHVAADMVRAAVGLVHGGYQPPVPADDVTADAIPQGSIQ